MMLRMEPCGLIPEERPPAVVIGEYNHAMVARDMPGILNHGGPGRFDAAHLMDEGRGAGTDVARRRYMRGEINDHQLVDYCVRAVLRKRGTCNPRRDIQEQCYEIEKEVWYEGERVKRPVPAERREEIARSWATEHASKWREWRLFQLLYVWEKKADVYMPILTSDRSRNSKL